MTAQEIFDKAAVGLLTQKAKSYLVNPDGHTKIGLALIEERMVKNVQLDFVLRILSIRKVWNKILLLT
jgi:hypothetical protein